MGVQFGTEYATTINAKLTRAQQPTTSTRVGMTHAGV